MLGMLRDNEADGEIKWGYEGLHMATIHFIIWIAVNSQQLNILKW